MNSIIMYKLLVFVCLAIFIMLVSTTEAKGGRGGGGRGGGRSSGRSSSSRRGSTSSISSSSSFGGSHSGMRSGGSGGWFHGVFHSTPYRYTYRPTYISSSHPNTKSYQGTKEEEILEKDNDDHALGYAISRALNSDFFSIFNVVHDVSKYPEKIKNKEFLTSTTTEGPVSTYHINEIINPTYTRSTTTFDSKSYLLDDHTIFEMINRKEDLDFNKKLEQSIEDILQTYRDIDKSSEKPTEEITTVKIELTKNIFL